MKQLASSSAIPRRIALCFAAGTIAIALTLAGNACSPNKAFANTMVTGTNPSILRTSTDALLNPQQVTATGENVTHHTAGTCDWYIDENGCLTIQPLDGASIGVLPDWRSSERPPWYYAADQIKSVALSGKIKAQTCIRIFCNCSSLTSLDLSGLDTSGVTHMGEMFCGCSSLTSLDLSGLDTSSVTDMPKMFCGCSSLSSLDLSSFDTSKATCMWLMFSGCSSLAALDLSGFETSKVVNMGGMFCGCSSLTSLDLSGLDTSGDTHMGEMFCGCSSLTELDLSSFDTSNVTNAESMFENCSSLRKIALGSDFEFKGKDPYKCTLPTPTGDGLTGKWVSSANGKAYSPDAIPSGVAATYTAETYASHTPSTPSDSDPTPSASSKTDISSGTITLSNSTVIFEGKALEPTVEYVKANNGKALTEDVDYTIAYSNNGGFGSGTVTVTGAGNYSGILTASFDIVSKVVDVFSDASYDDWYVESGSLDYAYAHGLISGYSGTDLVGAYDPIKRQDVAVILWRMAGEPEVASGDSFEDVDYGDYYGPAVRWARATGVINGYQDADGAYRNFGPSDLVTREQLAAMIANYAEKVGGMSVASNCAKLDALPDAGDVSDWARASVGWCMANDIMNGVNVEGTAYAQPAGNAWRASMASMAAALHRDVLKLG